MKKILIGILTILFIVLIVITLTKGINIGKFRIPSIKEIKNKSNSLKQDIETANELTKKTYPETKGTIESVIKGLAISKEKYESKTKYMKEDLALGVVQVKSYKVEFLWITIENYAKKEGLVLKMDVEGSNNVLNASANNVYKLNFTLTGSYIGVTDFIYDIENDEDLGFEVKNLAVEKLYKKANEITNTVGNTVGNTATKNVTKDIKNNISATDNGRTVKATFEVENIGIEF